jgi:hypothetical protein
MQAEKEPIAPAEPPADWREPIKPEPVTAPLPERLPPQLDQRAQIHMSVTANQRELVGEYLAFLKDGVEFAQTWARWKRVHDQLMQSATYDYQLFRIEADLWHNLQTEMGSMRGQRVGKSYVEKK